jgi:hypothetical protein
MSISLITSTFVSKKFLSIKNVPTPSALPEKLVLPPTVSMSPFSASKI